MVTSASDMWPTRRDFTTLAAMVEAEDAHAAKQLEITGYETDLADAGSPKLMLVMNLMQMPMVLAAMVLAAS